MKNEQCVLCGDDVGEWGNNPQPLANEGKCCDNCNWDVIQARLGNLEKD